MFLNEIELWTKKSSRRIRNAEAKHFDNHNLKTWFNGPWILRRSGSTGMIPSKTFDLILEIGEIEAPVLMTMGIIASPHS
jgi:hypothetical protein